jgi:hypothetical protein
VDPTTRARRANRRGVHTEHITKAVGILSSIAEWADHGRVRLDRVPQDEYEGRVADLVMCALHIANNPPEGYARFDLERAVVTRTEAVNGRGFGNPDTEETP